MEHRIETGNISVSETSTVKQPHAPLPESKVPSIIYTKPQTAEPESESSSGSSDIRLTILNELSSLFQAKKNLDTNNPINKLGSLGTKMKKTKKKKKKK